MSFKKRSTLTSQTEDLSTQKDIYLEPFTLNVLPKSDYHIKKGTTKLLRTSRKFILLQVGAIIAEYQREGFSPD